MSHLKPCSICGESKPVDDFRKLKNGRSSHCKPCAATHLREWRAKNADKLKAQRRERTLSVTPEEKAARQAAERAGYAKNPDRWRSHRLRHQYGITLDQYREMLKSQGGVCAICKKECISGRSLAVDHDHETDKVRQLLCANCNRGLGFFQDSPELLKIASAYLDRHSGMK